MFYCGKILSNLIVLLDSIRFKITKYNQNIGRYGTYRFIVARSAFYLHLVGVCEQTPLWKDRKQ